MKASFKKFDKWNVWVLLRNISVRRKTINIPSSTSVVGFGHRPVAKCSQVIMSKKYRSAVAKIYQYPQFCINVLDTAQWQSVAKLSCPRNCRSAVAKSINIPSFTSVFWSPPSSKVWPSYHVWEVSLLLQMLQRISVRRKNYQYPRSPPMVSATTGQTGLQGAVTRREGNSILPKNAKKCKPIYLEQDSKVYSKNAQAVQKRLPKNMTMNII